VYPKGHKGIAPTKAGFNLKEYRKLFLAESFPSR
jgi:hypothetical protein